MNFSIIPEMVEIQSVTISDVADIITIGIGCLAIYLTYLTLRHRRHNLSMDVFDRALNEFGTEDARRYRKHIYENFLPSAYFGKEDLVDINNIPFFQLINDDDITKFKNTSVRADRIGFMFFTLNLSPRFKKQYIDWLCSTYCELWNRLAVHVDEERDWRNIQDRFVPYFEKLAYLSYYRYRKYNNDARIIFLDQDKLQCMERLYNTWWDC